MSSTDLNFESKLRSVFADGTHNDYDQRIRTVWDPVVKLMIQMGCPTAQIEDTGGAGYVIMVTGEDPYDYVWLGCTEADDRFGPWLMEDREHVNYVGGAHYIIHDVNSMEDWLYTDSEYLQVEGDPLNDYDMAESMVACWRLVREIEPTNAM